MKRFCKQIFARGRNWLLVLLSIALVIALILTVYTLTKPAQHQAEPASPEYVFDDLGRLVAINGTPQRIVSLAPSNTEILFALGLGDKVVGVTDWCDYPPEALEKEKVGSYDTPDIEKIFVLNPDLALAAYGTTMDVINNLDGLGLTVFGIKTTDLDDLLNDIKRVGEITDKEVEAQALTSEMASKFEVIADATSELKNRPRVFYIFWHDPLWTAGSGTFIHELIEKAGGVNICQNITGYTTISIEEVVARDPEIIITSSWTGIYEWAMNSTALEVTAARQSGSVYTCDDNLVQRPGPRLVEGLEWFAYFIHPEIFGRPSSISNYPMEIVDQMGRTVTITTEPVRIISLSTANTEILFALGAGSRIVGVDDCSKRDLKGKIPELEEVDEVGSYAGVDVEKIIALQPDLVLAVPYQKEAVENLEELGLPVVTLEARSMEAVFNNIKLIGRIIEREEDTSIVIANIEERLKNITETTSELTEAEKPTALYLCEPLWIAGSNTMANDLIQKGGGVNIFSDVDGYKEVDLEAIIARDPQVIFCVQGYAPTLEYIMGEIRLEKVAAVKNGRVYGIQAALVDIPGPRIIDALDLIARYLHPELFEEGK